MGSDLIGWIQVLVSVLGISFVSFFFGRFFDWITNRGLYVTLLVDGELDPEEYDYDCYDMFISNTFGAIVSGKFTISYPDNEGSITITDCSRKDLISFIGKHDDFLEMPDIKFFPGIPIVLSMRLFPAVRPMLFLNGKLLDTKVYRYNRLYSDSPGDFLAITHGRLMLVVIIFAIYTAMIAAILLYRAYVR